MSNLRENLPHGNIMKKKHPNHSRLYFQNPNGFQLVDPHGGTFLAAMEMIRDADVDGGGFSEINLDTTKYQVMKKLRVAVHKTSKQCKLSATSSPVSASYEYKPGGTLTYLRNDLVSRYHSKGSDPYGRWSYITLNSRGHQRVTIVTAYQPCYGKPKTDGSMTVITQQYSQFLEERRPTPAKVRRHFINDLIVFLYTLKAQRSKIILAGDFNETIGATGNGMSKICRLFNLVDPVHHLHGPAAMDYATWIDGNKMLDYILVDASLIPAVKFCGYEPFQFRVQGDHRGMFIDFDTSTLFGKENSQLANMAKRRIHSNNPHEVTAYINHKMKYLTDHNFFHNLQLLKDHPDDKLAERLDKTLLRSSLYAESKLPQYPEVPFSPAVAQLRYTLSVYRLLLFQHHHNIQLHEQLRDSIAAKHDDFIFPTTLEECKTAYDATLTALKKAEKDAVSHRKDFLERKAQTYSESGDLSSEAYLKRLKQCEDMSRVFKKCAYARGKIQKGGFSTIDVPAVPNTDPKKCTRWRTIDCPKEIETILLERNRKHFGQAQGTPITVPPLSQEINFEASTHTTDLILNGSYTDSDLDDITQTFVDHLQRVSPPAVESDLTMAQFESKIKSWNEKTSTSPSGQHLGHYKALFAPHAVPKLNKAGEPNEDFKKFEDDRSAMADAHLYLINYAIEHGYSYERWQKIITMMIEKEKGNHKIHRLRVIHIYEADYNALLCIKWREVTHHASRMHLINSSQNGGVPGCYATDPVFVEELEYEICRATRTPLGKGDYDATSCYDRIHCFLANASSQKYGLNRKVCIVQGKTLKQARYHLRTQLGVSKGSISHCEVYPIYGTGQGSGNSPVYWMFISSTLFDCHSLKAHGARFTSPDGSITITLHMLGFVDDTSNRTNYFERAVQPSVEEIVHLMRHDTQIWNDLLYASGGELELTKCTYHHIRFIYDYKGRPTMKPGTFGPALIVKNYKGENVIIKQLPVSDSHKLLGCHKDPLGTQLKQFKVLQGNCYSLAKAVNNSILDRHETLIFYRHIYIPSVTYPLFRTYFSEGDMHRIQSQALRSLTRGCGYNSNTPELLLVGPTLYGGASFVHIFDSQSYQQLQMLIKHWRTQRDPGKVLKVALAWWQFVAGISQPILQYPHITLPHFDCESKYIKSVRDYLASIDARLELDDPGVPALQREHDVYIMEEVLKSERFTTTEIKYVNLCRLYLQVVTLSDIAKANGKEIDEAYRAGTPCLLSSTSRWLKNHQEKPRCKYVWKAWRKAIRLFAKDDSTLRRSYRLGNWLLDPNFLRMQWTAYYHPSDDVLYIHHNNTYTVHQRERQGFSFAPSRSTYLLPSNAAPTDLRRTDTIWTIRRDYCKHFPPPITPIPQDWITYQLTFPDWEQRLFFEIEFLQPDMYLMHAIEDGDLVIVSDGSAPDKASFGWIMSTAAGVRLVQCYGPAFGYHPSSYRAEGYGMLSATCFLSRYIALYDLQTTKSPSQYCDNKGLLDNLKKYSEFYGHWYANDTLSAEWDILIQVMTTRHHLLHPPTLTHVKGHQDKEKDYASLSLPAQLNVDADALADKYMDFHYDQHRCAPLTLNARALIHLPVGSITNKLKRELQVAKRGPPMLQYLSNENNWTPDIAHSIDWDIHSTAVHKNIHPTTIFKFLHDCFPVGYIAHKNDPKHSPRCPDCDYHCEGVPHFYSCPSEARKRSKRLLLQNLSKTARDINTDPILVDIMVQGLESFLSDGPVPYPFVYPLQYRPLIANQNEIGWKNFLKGRWSLYWRRLQKHHFHIHPTPPNPYKKSDPNDPRLWSISLINTLWEWWFEMWTVRNKSRHGQDQLTRREAARQHALYELDQLYALQHTVHTSHQFIFDTPLHVLKEKKTHQIQNWISLWKPLITGG